MREWSRLPLVAPPSPELPLARSSAPELEKLSQIYHSPQKKKKLRRLKAEALSGPRVGESERQTATVAGGGEEDFRRGKNGGSEKEKKKKTTLRKATQRAEEEKTISTAPVFCATHNVESESWTDR